ncbi:hypothetical protein M9H77_16982 [Catharanthus roseus]|uniref:Uncharacterized protein n=1 Tax=Catharanthus roseus TaxID=4058 RepID=A0ACC0B3A7_CATRO|nr:hypothetical protein M9H77_16982 [Catharanthus roseus]
MTVESRQVQLMAVHRIQSLSLRIVIMSLVVYGVDSLGQASRVDAKELSGCWLLLEAWIYLYFLMFAPPVRPGVRLCKPHIQKFAMLGHKIENKLIDLHIRLDTMLATRLGGIRTDPMRLLMYGFLPHPIYPQEHRGPANNRVYMVKDVFIEAFWLEASSHLLTSTWTNIPTIPPSRCTNDYMSWFSPVLIQGFRIRTGSPARMQLPTTTPITAHVLLDMAACELDREDIDDTTKVGKASNMIKRYHQTRR